MERELDMRIGTFGSCLSRYTANQFVKLFGGKIITSVYHNRSDAFVGRFVDNTWGQCEFSEVASQLVESFDGENDKDNMPINILRNQYPQTMGLHRLAHGKPFIEAVEEKLIDILFVDNYMDIAAKLVSNNEGYGYFLRMGDFSTASPNWHVGDYLSPESGVENMRKIIGHVKGLSPDLNIVFLNFPHNTYQGNLDRVKRTKLYEELFDYPGVHVVPCLDVPEIYQTNQKQHFKVQQYAAYAGISWGLLR